MDQGYLGGFSLDQAYLGGFLLDQAYLRGSYLKTNYEICSNSRPLLRKLIKDTNIHLQYTCFRRGKSQKGLVGRGERRGKCHSSGNKEKQRETGTKAEMKETDRFKKLI